MAIYCCAVSVALGRARGAKPGQRCWLPWDQNLWGCAGALHGALWGAWECCPIPAPLHPRPEDPALQLLPEAAHVPPVHRPRPARQPRGGHRLVSARAPRLPAQGACSSWEHGFSPPSCWNWYFDKTSQAGGPSSNPLDGCGGILWHGHVHFPVLSGSAWPSDTVRAQ